MRAWALWVALAGPALGMTTARAETEPPAKDEAKAKAKADAKGEGRAKDEGAKAKAEGDAKGESAQSKADAKAKDEGAKAKADAKDEGDKAKAGAKDEGGKDKADAKDEGGKDKAGAKDEGGKAKADAKDEGKGKAKAGDKGKGKAKRAAGPVVPPSIVTPELVRELEGADESRAVDAVHRLGAVATTDAAALTALIDALGHGPTRPLTLALVAALGGKGDNRAVTLLARYADHRAPEVRRAALDALAALPESDPRPTPTLERALGDSDGEVRAEAAKLVAARKDHGAEERLIKLMEHRDVAAAGALGAVGTPALAHRLSELVGSVPDPILCEALGEMLKRPDFGPELIRVELVRTLAKVPGADATAALVEYLAATQSDSNRPSRLEAQKVVDERSRQ